MIINNGKIVADGTANTLRNQAQGQEILHVKIEDEEDHDLLFKSLQALESVAIVDFKGRDRSMFEVQSKSGESSKRNIFQLCVKNNWVLTQMTPQETKLEDIFRNLTMN